MALWQVKTKGNTVQLGSVRQDMTGESGCNQPFKGRYWCPSRKWFLSEPCPFMNRTECRAFRQLCGGL